MSRKGCSKLFQLQVSFVVVVVVVFFQITRTQICPYFPLHLKVIKLLQLRDAIRKRKISDLEMKFELTSLRVLISSR